MGVFNSLERREMKLAICNELFENWPWEELCDFVSSIGYRGIEVAPFTLAERAERITPDQRARLRAAAVSRGLQIIGLHWLLAKPPGFYITHPDAAIREATTGYFIQLVNLCADLGGKVLVIGSPKQRNLLPGVNREQAMGYAVQVFTPCLEPAAGLGVTLAIEPLSPRETDFLTCAADAVELIERIGHPNFRLQLDAKAMSYETKPIPQIIRESAKHLAHFHVNDPNLLGPGMGEIRYEPIIAALREAGYDGWLSVEAFDFRYGAKKIARESAAYLEKVGRMRSLKRKVSMTMAKPYPRMVRFKTAESFLEYLRSLKIDLPFDGEVTRAPEGPLARPYRFGDGRTIGNRFCIHPMEGWDGTRDGRPTDLTFRRWRNFGLSGAKLIWGGEATAVRPDGRANPNQLMIIDQTLAEMEKLRLALVDEHRARFGTQEDLMVGLQLTHSGRFCRPNDKMKLEPRILYHHPPVEAIYHTPPDWPIMTDGEIDALIGDYVLAARRARTIGFEFVDIKHCHGYLGHEFLSAYSRPGRYGGSFENRTRFLREIVTGIRRDCPDLRLGVRVSAFDFPPFQRGEDGTGRMVEFRDESGRYPFAFGGDPRRPGQPNVEETVEFLALLKDLGIHLVNISAGSPYYNPHTMRPASFPPSDGYLPPEDPLVGVARHIDLCAQLKKRVPGPAIVGSAYTYLQEWLPNVAQAAVRRGMVDFVGLGRMVLAYPEMPADVLAGRPLARTRICRTFSDCTTSARNGLVSGCYPLDDYYKQRPEYEELKRIKTPAKEKRP